MNIKLEKNIDLGFNCQEMEATDTVIWQFVSWGQKAGSRSYITPKCQSRLRPHILIWGEMEATDQLYDIKPLTDKIKSKGY